MAADEAPAGISLSQEDRPLPDHRQTIVMVRSALIISCAYLILFSQAAPGPLGLLVIAAFLASNLVVGRLRPEMIGTQPFNVAIATLDTLFIALSMYCAGQMSVQLIVLFLGVLVLAIAGLSIGVIAGVTLGITGAYLLLLWVAGADLLMRSSMLLQVPFLLCAAMVYGWVTEAARMERAADGGGTHSDVRALATSLSAQLEVIARCQAALADGSHSAALAALDTIAAQNREMQARIVGTESPAAAGVSPAPSPARSAA